MLTISVADLDIIFGSSPKSAFLFLDQGLSRHEIMQRSGQFVGVRQANLVINQGEIFVIMGLSGSGKSTLLRALNGLSPITRGAVNITLLDGPNFCLSNANQALLRKLRCEYVATVFQNFALFPWKSVAENVAFGLEIARLDKSEREQRIKDTLRLVGLTQWQHHYPSSLSGGMQQRVGLARALATKAPILLMDEPFSALDPVLKSHLQQELLSLQKNLNKTIVFVTHDLDEALKLGSQIAIMQEGQIIQIDTPENIICRPKNKYVKDFIQTVDHTRVLRARTIMTSLEELKTTHDHSRVHLDHSGNYQCFLDKEGYPRRSFCYDSEGRIIPWTMFQGGTFHEHDLVLGPEHLMIKDVIKAVENTKRPMIIQDKSGRMIGAITTDAIMKALARN